MYNAQKPADIDLPTNSQLLKSTIIALTGAIAILVTVVLPAEFGIDPTGAGNLLGLKRMGEIKVSLEAELKAEQQAEQQAAQDRAAEAAEARQKQIAPVAPARTAATATATATAGETTQATPATVPTAAPVTTPAPPVTPETVPVWRDSETFILKPNDAAEIKAIMGKGQSLHYRWSTDKGKTNYDIHGDSKALSIRYHNYEKGSVPGKEGTITADFDGSHGWFWRNRHSETQTIVLQVSGEYEKLVRVK